MRRLMLLRHAKTEIDAPSGRDRDRRLDDRGHKDAGELGGWIGRHPPFPDRVMVSPAMRAKQTWELAWEAMKDRVPPPPVEFLPELYGADPAQLLQSIRNACVTDPTQLIDNPNTTWNQVDSSLPYDRIHVFARDGWVPGVLLEPLAEQGIQRGVFRFGAAPGVLTRSPYRCISRSKG